ncbi:DEAD/DEAH box helicase [Sphingobacterium rhinopitheci]|uniref:DEAD/DEAH box helicase n=1 Tax=Sphingobacterium rhinopitheci TaxID=2781960 RepID=UPI001F5256EE|nr:SNF2-related protein [Sphingobacterium rhinopitheci]MCI0921026.1 ATP-dependent helicase [Sphingobacterium rhinopitheci]
MQQINSRLPFKLIYSLGHHPYLGYLIEPHIVQLNNNGTLSLSYKRVFTNTVEEYSAALDETDYKIIKLLDEIEQTHVIKKFYKKAIRPADFFGKIFDTKIYDIIRPQLEQKLVKVLALIKEKPLYLMNKKDGYPAEQKVNIAQEPTSILFHFRRNESETRYFPTLKYKDHRMEFMFKDAEVIINTQAWLLMDHMLYHFDQPLEGKKLTPFLNKRYIAVAKSTEKKYFETFVTGLIEKYNVYAEGFEIKTIKENAVPILTLNYIPDGESQLQLSFSYGDYNFVAGGEQKLSVKLAYEANEDLYTFTRIKRSTIWEENLQIYLEELGLKKLDALFGSYITSSNSFPNVFEWLNNYQSQLTEKGFEIKHSTGDKQFFIGKTTLDIEVVEDNDWFDVRAFANFGPYKIPFIQLRDHILNRIQEFKLPNGEIAIIPEEWFAQYEHLFQFAVKKDSLHLHKTHIGVLHEISEHTALTMSRKLQNLSNFEEIPNIEQPKEFKGALRPYQQAGYNWFHFLQEFNFGGVLADDMGLGKTVQTLALLQRQKEESKSTDHAKTSLLILPTSLVYNWHKEAQKFAPQLRILLHTGSNRFKDPFAFSHFDLVITTYGIARSDEELLSKFFFNYIILDESQNIKNPTSKSFKAIKLFKSRHKLALSGTPIENSVSDIWSQMHFTNPGLLGNYSYFQKEFVIPIEKKKDEDIAKRLQAIIKPFILRRTKNQVATELPPKTEQIIYCEMTEGQGELYESTKSEYRNALLEGTVQQGTKNTQIALLQGLTKLRQLANHPKMTEEDYKNGSGKFDAVIEMLSSISSEGNKVLIFSQFVKHLEIFKSYFERKNIPFAYLDGGTKDRAEAVNYFKNNDDVRIFLISIKAGGVGLNLTEADYVFILDPWWNPAVEQQAIDRSHRIGQTRNVFIYKFITKDTVEEKIVALQNRKKSIATSLVTTEESFVKSLSQDDLKELLR